MTYYMNLLMRYAQLHVLVSTVPVLQLLDASCVRSAHAFARWLRRTSNFC